MSSRPGKLSLPWLVALALTVAACGGSSSTTATRSVSASRPTRLYTVGLTGRAEVPKGAPSGRGVAIIAFHGESTVCWRFAHLHGFTGATSARIYRGAAGRPGPVALSLSHSRRLHHQGCTNLPASLTTSMWGDPGGYYVNIHSTGYPHGAVRGQL